jgi:hypothetical protein
MEIPEEEALTSSLSVYYCDGEQKSSKKRKREQSENEDEVEEGNGKMKFIRIEGSDNRKVIEEEVKKMEEEKTFPTIKELIWNRKERLVGFLRKVLPAHAQNYAEMVHQTSVEDWVSQFQVYVIPLYRVGLIRVVIQKIMDKVGVKVEDLGKDISEARFNYEVFTRYMINFARLIQKLDE